MPTENLLICSNCDYSIVTPLFQTWFMAMCIEVIHCVIKG